MGRISKLWIVLYDSAQQAEQIGLLDLKFVILLYFRCGASCNWTVPSGVTCARFQIWGVGEVLVLVAVVDHLMVDLGAYASVIIPVSPGDTHIPYVLVVLIVAILKGHRDDRRWWIFICSGK